MNKENTGYLFENFNLFDLNKSIFESQMTFGFDCGDGWFEIVRDFCEKLRSLKMIEAPDIEIIEVKEKSGTLRITVINVPEEYRRYVNKLIDDAETKSTGICELCGKSANIRRHKRIPWIAYVLCDSCMTREKY